MCVWIIAEVLLMVAASCSASCDLNHVCSSTGTIAAVTEVHVLYDVICCLTVDQGTLQGSFWQMDMRTLIKFPVLLGNSALKCYKSLKEVLGTHAPSYGTVH